MAGISRNIAFGTIFSRLSALMRSGAMKAEDRPLWYDVYERFPPVVEPRKDTIHSIKPVKTIYYPEDIIRAKFYQAYPGALAGVMDLRDEQTISIADKFVHTFLEYHRSGQFPSEQAAWDATAQDLQLVSPDALDETRAQQHQQLMQSVPTRSSGGGGTIAHDIDQLQGHSMPDVGMIGEGEGGSILDMYESALAQEQEMPQPQLRLEDGEEDGK